MKKHERKKILFLCTANSARSQMAEALMRHYRGDEFECFSAGIAPSGVNPYAVKVLSEIGVDISGQYSKHIDDLPLENFDYIITVCDNAAANCPVFSGKGMKIHKGFEDPASVSGTSEQITTAFRKVRDELKEFIINFGGKG